jgi:hypothetical protein
MRPQDIVDRNLVAYADGDLDAMGRTLAADVRMGGFSGRDRAVGREAVLGVYAKTIAHFPLERTRSLNRITIGRFVLDHEVSVSVTDERLYVASLYACSDEAIERIVTVTSKEPPQGLNVVQAQLDAYNAQALDDLAACYAEDARLRRLGEDPHCEGRAAVVNYYGDLFRRFPENHATLINRIAVGGWVFDAERVRRRPDMPDVEALCIYATSGGGIASVEIASSS